MTEMNCEDPFDLLKHPPPASDVEGRKAIVAALSKGLRISCRFDDDGALAEADMPDARLTKDRTYRRRRRRGQ